MKSKLFIIAMLVLQSLHIEARNLAAFFSVCTFNSPENGPYIETYLNVVGNSVKLVSDIQGKYQGKIEVEMTFTQGGEIRYHDKYNLLGTKLNDTIEFRPDFIDQQRILLPDGDYNLNLKITDKFSPDQSFSANRAVKVDFPKGILSISDIELLDTYSKATEENKFTKSGMNIVPLVSDYYPESVTSVKFYAEIYNTKNVLNENPFVINYFISGSENKYIAANLAGYKREMPKDVCIILTELPIKELYTGNYNLTVEVRNKNNDLLAVKRTFFQRNNMKSLPHATGELKSLDITNTFVKYITNKDTMMDYIESVRPISASREMEFADNQLHIADLKYMQQFFYDFWERRNPTNPEKAWHDYYLEVRKVNAAYSTRTTRGYATDRGRVYLQYGPPNTIKQNENEAEAYPYEIWHYYELENQTNCKFLFYCHEPATNLYTLLHSTAKGEVYNSRWQIDLYSRNTRVRKNDFDQLTDPAQTGSQAVEDFNNPR